MYDEADPGEIPHPLMVLIVDDQPDVADTLAELLNLQGYTASVAYSAEAALAWIRETVPDVVICDLAMPRRDGLSLCRELRELPELHATRFIACTAYSDLAHAAAAKTAGFHHFLCKGGPTEPILELLQQISRERLIP